MRNVEWLYLHSSKSCLKETLCLGESPSESPFWRNFLLTTTGLSEATLMVFSWHQLSAEPKFRLFGEKKNCRLQTFPCHNFCLVSYVYRWQPTSRLNSINLTIDQRRRSTCSPESGSRSHMRTEKSVSFQKLLQSLLLFSGCCFLQNWCPWTNKSWTDR